MNFGYLALKKNSEYLEVYTKGKADGNPWFTVFFSINEDGCTKAGLSVSKKIGKAHERNYYKRRMRVILRDNFDCLPKGYNYIFILKPSIKDSDFKKMTENWMKLVNKLNERLKNG